MNLVIACDLIMRVKSVLALDEGFQTDTSFKVQGCVLICGGKRLKGGSKR